MVPKWIAKAIIVGLLVALTPVAISILWAISELFVSVLLLISLLLGFTYLVISAIDKDIEIKRLKEQLEDKGEDE